MANIILLEPDTILAKLYVEGLAHAGHAVRKVISAQEAVFEVDTLMPDLVIVELQLVAHSGIEFLYELRSYPEWQHIPVLVQSLVPPSEFADSAELLRGRLGVEAYLYKPHVSLEQLIGMVDDILLKRQAAQTYVGRAADSVVKVQS